MPKFDKNQYLLSDVYKFYKQRCKERGVVPVTYKEHKNILDTWGRTVVQYLSKGKDVKLHSGLSILCVRKTKTATYVDFKESKKAQDVVSMSNAHSAFYVARTRWRRHYTTISSSGWSFKASSRLARAIHNQMIVPGGHRVYVRQSRVTSKENQRKSMHTKHILNL